MDDTRIPDLATLKAYGEADVAALIPRLRSRIVEVVSQTGGHLASNLGVVELTVALHRVFDSPRDKIVFDVGHQCYAHKMLTGRDGQMDSLRQLGGLSGFPKRTESPHDAYGTGHASTAISAALGMARARDLQGGREHVVAVVGDGALTGGLCYEALNDAGSGKTRLIVILNDNQMSIQPNVGAVSNYLTYLRTSKGWLSAKKRVADFLLRLPLVGRSLHGLLQRVKNHVRNIFIKDELFQNFGFRYLGPVDGHDEPGLEKILRRARAFDQPVLLHIVTQKGKGYAAAENAPDKTHGVSPFDPVSGSPRVTSLSRSFGEAAGALLRELAEKDESIVAVTAAMADSTGLQTLRERFPRRVFDVGIAEEHAVTMAAGMAASGLRPVVAVYDTFLQRAYDQVIVDVCVQHLPVVFLIDRAAIGGEDGPTHHGVFGTSFLRHIPGLTVLAPRCVDEMLLMLRWALRQDGPVAIRYPRAEQSTQALYPCETFKAGHWETLSEGADLTLIASGPMVNEAIKAQKLLLQGGIGAGVINASSIKPLDGALLMKLGGRPYVVMEEQALLGGLGSAICEYCVGEGLRLPLHLFALPDYFIPHGAHDKLLRSLRLDGQSVAEDILGLMEKTA
ncbi:MAG: 1-deoxy-D-xylulose-5-phosphate synthase [Christensenellales bacterium]